MYFENLFQNKDIDSKHVYLLPRRVTVDTNLRIFQYKILNNVLYLNEKLFRYKNISCLLCSFCQSENETPTHLFHGCIKTNLLCYKLKKVLKTKIDLPINTPQNVRERTKLSFEMLEKEIMKMFDIEKKICLNDF